MIFTVNSDHLSREDTFLGFIYSCYSPASLIFFFPLWVNEMTIEFELGILNFLVIVTSNLDFRAFLNLEI